MCNDFSKIDEKYISVITIDDGLQKEESMFPSQFRLLARPSQIALSHLKEKLSEMTVMLSTILNELPENEANFQLSQATFSLSVNSSGKISLIGELAAGMNTSMTLTFTRKK